MKKWSEQVTSLVHPRGGLVRILKQIETKPGLPQMARYLAVMEAAHQTPLTVRGSGFSCSKESSQQSAVGEAIERYCGSFALNHEIRSSTYAEMTEPALDPTLITRPSPDQLSSQPHLAAVSSRSVFDWVKGEALSTGEATWLPFELVYQTAPRYKPVRDLISTGLACGPTPEFARRNALCECLERDAVMLFWQLRTVRTELLVEATGNRDIELLLHKAKQSNLTVRFFDITQEEFGAPTVVALVQAIGRPGFYLGSSTAFSYGDAIRKALQEGLGGYSVFFEFLHFYDRIAPERPEEVETLEDHALYYMAGHQDSVLDELFLADLGKHSAEAYLHRPPVTFSQVVRALAEQGHPAYQVELTTADVRQVGFYVYRVITPTLLFLPVREPYLECERLRSKQRELQRNLNALPHPFP